MSIVSIVSRRRRGILLDSSQPIDESQSTFTNGTFAPTADGSTTATLTFTARDANGNAAPNKAVTFAVARAVLAAGDSIVTASPTTIDDDGVDASAITVEVLAPGSIAVPGIPAASVVIASTGSTNTIVQPSAATSVSGQTTGSIASTTGQVKTVSATVCGLAITDTASVTVDTAYVAPTLVDNVSFETTWDSFTDGGAGDPTASSPHTIERSTTQAFAGTTSVKFYWETNATDKGASFFRQFGSSEDEVWLRFYFWLDASWSITSVQKWCRFRSPSTQYGGFYLSDAKGIAWGFDLEAGAVTASIIPKVDIPTETWNYLEVNYRRNGDTYPNAAFWLNGSPVTKTDGADAAGNGLTWESGRLNPSARSNSTQLASFQMVGTLNAGNTGTGTIYIDRVAVSDAGRIGP